MGASPGTSEKIWTISNIITIVRILLVPVFVAALLAPWPEWFGLSAAVSTDWKRIVAAAIFVLISCTDWLDGYLARSRNEVTDFGKFMDPLADKILVAAALIALVELGSLPTWVVLVILAREFIVSGVRMMAASKGVVIAASMLGKFKTVFQMIAIVLFTIKDSHMIGSFGEALSDTLWCVSWCVMLVALGLTIASMVDYLVKARSLLGFGSKEDSTGDGSSREPSLDPDRLPSIEELESCASEAAHSLVTHIIEAGADTTIASAESLTGGMIGEYLTSVPGSSSVYLGGIISYTNGVKETVLGVDGEVLRQQGAVSRETACEMALQARMKLAASMAVSVTGIAGPGGAEPGKPVGTVWMGFSTAEGTDAGLYTFTGDRAQVRLQTTIAALEKLDSYLTR